MSEGGHIEIKSGISLFDGKGFCQVVLDGKPIGQLTPAGVRTMALNWLAAADAAESDSAVFAELQAIGIEQQQAASFIQSLRARRDP